MRSAAFLLSALLFAASAAAQTVPDGTATHVALGIFAVAAVGDVAWTEYAMGQGVGRGQSPPYRELNPAYRWAVERGATTAAVVKGSADFVVGWWLVKQHADHPTRTFWTAATLAGAKVALVIHNARTIRR